MSYAPIELSADVPEPIRCFVRESVGPLLLDVRRMLALPAIEGQAGGSLAMAPVLLSIMGALSRLFFNGIVGDKTSFMALADRYPTADEPSNGIKDPKKFGPLIYAHYRANLVHGLGLQLERDSRYLPWRLLPLAVDGNPVRLEVVRARAQPVPETALAALDAASGWPHGVVGPTLSCSAGALRLELEALYCGLRRLTRVLAEDPSLQPGAVALLRPWFAALQRRDAATATAILSSPQPQPAPQSAAAASSEPGAARDRGVGGRGC